MLLFFSLGLPGSGKGFLTPTLVQGVLFGFYIEALEGPCLVCAPQAAVRTARFYVTGALTEVVSLSPLT